MGKRVWPSACPMLSSDGTVLSLDTSTYSFVTRSDIYFRFLPAELVDNDRESERDHCEIGADKSKN